MTNRVNSREPDGLAGLLRQEAARERPLFSEALHGRILRRLPGNADAPAVIRHTEPRAGRAGRSAWWPLGVAAAAVAVAVAIAVIAGRPEPAGGQPRSVAVVAAAPSGGSEDAAEGGSPDAAELGIERVPLFDELEEGMRASVSTLAATLLDVPEWRMLADFDAAGFLGADPTP